MQPRSRSSLPAIVVLAAFVLIIGVVLAVVALPRATSNPAPIGGSFTVTIFPTHPGPTAIPPQVIEQPTAPSAPTIEPTVAPRVTQYVVQQNDTLWDIAIRFGFTTLDPLVAANPGINPDFLSLGQVLNIPGADFGLPPRQQTTPLPIQPQPQQGQFPIVVGQVIAEAGGLRLRDQPSYEGNVITRLGPDTQLQILGQVAGESWIKVITPNGTQGYVDARYVSVGGASILPTQPAAEEPAAPIPVGPLEYPFLSDVTSRVSQIFRDGQAKGNHPNAFSIVGDSNSQNPAFMKPIDWGVYNLGAYSYLQSTIDYFKGSFGRDSPASIGGFNTSKVLDPGNSPSSCNGQTPLACEYHANRPSVSLILLGTGDQHTWQGFEGRYRQIIEYTIAQGIIPVLITKADDLECRDNNAPCGFINGKIAQLANEYQVPLLNLRQVVERLPGGGCIGDGFHFSFATDNKSAYFTPDYLQYGYNQRNLTALEVLDVLRRKVITPGA